MTKKITVIGGGGTGQTLAADLSQRGYEVSLCEEPGYGDKLKYVSESGGVEISGALQGGFVPLERAVVDFDKAVAEADVILVAVIANRHQSLARRIQPLLRDGQSILIGPDNGGSLVFGREFRELGSVSGVLLGGMGGNYYACRLVGPARVYVGMPRGPKKVAAFPASDTDDLIESLNGLFEFTRGTSALEIALSTPNIPNHLAGAILNTSVIESMDGSFNLFRHGLTPSVLRCIDSVAAERNAVMRALGYDEIYSQVLAKVAQLDQHPEFDMFRDLAGPSNLRHRYVTEDAEIGMSLLVSLGQLTGVDTPVSAGLVSLASAINDTDYLATGRTVARIGLDGMSVAGINEYLQTGSASKLVSGK